MKKILPQDWIPSDGLKLEDNAQKAITAPGNTLVVAGPGSGKTELLAQKACFLLQTGACPHPRRILAISFKRDAAFNIKDRVIKRCGQALSQRFDSYTFDKFAKQMLDRLRAGIPEPYNVPAEYELLVTYAEVKDEIANAIKAADYKYYNTHSVDGDFLVRTPLPHDLKKEDDRVRQQAWLNLTSKAKAKVDFRMIMRLAQFIMESNPILKQFLQQTYSHVFLDEFQDTTFLQYDFLNACFADSGVNYTAVGDDKQMIMEWAGAIPDIFKRYIADKAATPLPLKMNFRSAPELVNLQNYLVEHLLGKKDFSIPSPQWKGGKGEARMCFFDNQAAEINYLVQEIKKWVLKEKLVPREICILVKQTPPRYTQELIAALIENGVRARDEMILQDLLCEEVVIYVLDVLTVIFSGQYGKASDDAFNYLCNLNSSYDDSSLLKMKRKLIKYFDEKRSVIKNVEISAKQLGELIVDIVKFAGIEKIKLAFPQFQQGNYLKKTVNDLYLHLNQYYKETKDLSTALDVLLGKDSIPIMTAHKSKGLEYHSVIFVGLEDKAFWTYDRQKSADDNLVFVALSRAKERVLFTFCENRNGPKPAVGIEGIHKILEASKGVTIVDVRK